MNNITLFTILISLITGCASNPKFKNLNQSQEQKIRYIITYPSFSGMTKADAKTKRKEFMEEAIANIYASIFRLAYFGRSDFNPEDFGGLDGHSLDYGNIPFVFKGGNPPIIEYDYFTNSKANFGKISSTSYSKNNMRYSGGDFAWSYPIAKTISDEYIISPKFIQDKIINNVLIVGKNSFTKALNEYYINHDIVDSKIVFNEFLRNHAYKFVNYRNPISSLYKTLFTKSKSLQSGAGLSDEVTELTNTLNFSIQEEINRQLVWGLVFLLESNLSAQRINEGQLEVLISVPFNKILSKYKVEPLSKYIEQ